MEDSKHPDFVKAFYLKRGFSTRALHAGEHFGQPHTPAHVNPIYQTSTFVFSSAEEGAKAFAGQDDAYIYTRLGNPTVKVTEAKLNALEGAGVKLANPDIRVSTLAFSSGMAAITASQLACAKAGDEILLGNVVYGATESLAYNVLNNLGIKAFDVDVANLEAVQKAIGEHPKAKAIFFETPMNPTLALADIAAVAKIVRQVNPDIVVIVDNTFSTPYLQRPLELGADVVVHSATKYLSGHGTVVGGLVTTTLDWVKDELYKLIKNMGSSPGPFDAWLINQGLKTLAIRMEKHCSNAMAVAKYLSTHPKVSHVYYPGLENHPQHELAKKQMKHFGGMLSFELVGGLEAGRKLMNTIEVFTLAVSLGCVDSLIQHPASMTHACVPQDKRLKGGISDGLVRVSVGIEDEQDLIDALDKALAGL
ncbi:MAG TPA: PLP-dependent aspartate aminotransferase family protein [Myxococcota bacterium]|nr:PLP-dependent aspartate aminotransferase family protein [Myxococcota bacterium]HPC92575.1 PLP-dependent aspartate aminotransferase family protein [Myxococcota bacterium]HRR74717.1 PLP-dependent aspartate aminotransferase family protein [Myxococcota bacterium]HRV18404.1 PLP-dependent aspartate aminotransferase family protein [Myxococcota bacterium]